MLKLEPKWVEKEFQWTSCVDDALATVSNYYGIEYRFSYAKAWDFKYMPYDKEKNILFEKRLDTKNASGRYHFLTKCHKTRMNYHYTDDTYELLKIVKNELLHNRPCSIKLDSYYIPWDWGYQHLHTNHVCMPVEINEKDIQVIDPYNHKTGLFFPIDGLREASGFCITYEIDKENNEDFDCRSILIQVMEQLLGFIGKNNDFENMRLFAKDIREHFCVEKELADSDGKFYYSKLYLQLVELAFGRSFARQALLYSAERLQSNEIREVANSMRKMTSKFNYAIAMMQRTFKGEECNKIIMKESQKCVLEKVSNIFYDEADYEEKVANQLLEILRGNMDSASEADIKKVQLVAMPLNAEQNGDSFSIDLSDYYNNHALGDRDGKEDADFTGEGEYFLKDDFPNDRLIKYNGVEFKIGFDNKYFNDNVACKGQKINVDRKNVIQMDFMLAAEWGSYCEEIQVIYDTGIKTTISFSITDFAFEPKYGETVVYQGRTMMKSDNQVKPWQKDARLFAISIKELYGNIDSIILPVCEKIHIFAIRVLQ